MLCLNFFQQADSNKQILQSLTHIHIPAIVRKAKGCALEVDLEYPKTLRESQNDQPLAPDKLEIKEKMFSRYQ